MPHNVFYSPCSHVCPQDAGFNCSRSARTLCPRDTTYFYYFPDKFPSVCLQIQGVLVGGLAYFIRGGIRFRARADRYSLNLNYLLQTWKHGGYNCKATCKTFKMISASLSLCPFMPQTFLSIDFCCSFLTHNKQHYCRWKKIHKTDLNWDAVRFSRWPSLNTVKPSLASLTQPEMRQATGPLKYAQVTMWTIFYVNCLNKHCYPSEFTTKKWMYV